MKCLENIDSLVIRRSVLGNIYYKCFAKFYIKYGLHHRASSSSSQAISIKSMHYLRVVYTLQKNDQKEKKALKDEGKTLKPTRIAHLKTYNRISFQGHRFYF